jgi:hypothetical protein
MEGYDEDEEASLEESRKFGMQLWISWFDEVLQTRKPFAFGISSFAL